MKALTLVTTEAGKLDSVANAIRRIKGAIKEVLIVTGRADIAVFSEGSMNNLNKTIIIIGKIRGMETTETMFEIEMR